MEKITHTRKARCDLANIWDYIAEDNPSAATRILDTINEKCAFLLEYPNTGSPRPAIGQDMRYFPVGSYLIFYRPLRNGIEIVRVLHGARNWHALFSAED